MSADNCIGILRTITKDGKHEWRVADHHMVWDDDFENVKNNIDDKLSFLVLYRKSKVYLTQEEASKAAEELADGGVCEYGISEYQLEMEYPEDTIFVFYLNLRHRFNEHGNRTQQWEEVRRRLKMELTRVMPQYVGPVLGR